MADTPIIPLNNDNAEYWQGKSDDELEDIVRNNQIGSKNYDCARDVLDRRQAKRDQARQLFWIRLTFVVALAGIAATLAACSPEASEQAAEPPQPVEAPIPAITDHLAHNNLAAARIGLRNLYLSRMVRSAGEDCMVVDRSMYQGSAKLGDLSASLWSAHCENGSEWMVSLYPDATGSVLACGTLPSTKCWERFKD